MDFNDSLRKREIDIKNVVPVDGDNDYVLIYKEMDDILDECNLSLSDKATTKDIITHLEKVASDGLSDGKCIQIPYIGYYRRNPLYTNIVSRWKEFKDAKQTMPAHEYAKFRKAIVLEEQIKLRNAEVHKRFIASFRRYNMKHWLKAFSERGEAYANCWLVINTRWNFIEFNQELEDLYQNE